MKESNGPQQIISRVFGSLGSELFLHLFSQKPEKADAIIFLQGDRFDRAPKVISLYEQKYADQVLVVGNNVLIGKGKRLDEDNVSLEDMVEYLAIHGIPRKAILIQDGAMNTLGQAKNTIQLAKEKKWDSLLIVASPYLLLRSFLTFLKQAQEQGWRGKIIFQHADLLWESIPSGRTRTALDVLATELEKIQAYQKDMATVEEGILSVRRTDQACLVRNARKEDSKRVWEIRNSPLVRQNSTSNARISFKNHLRWFEDLYFQDRKNLCFVIECEANVMGYCRFDFDDASRAYTTSIAVDPSYHGKGLGRQLLSSALLDVPQNSVVNAAVKKGNPASAALFKKNSFAMTGEDKEYSYFRFIRRSS